MGSDSPKLSVLSEGFWSGDVWFSAELDSSKETLRTHPPVPLLIPQKVENQVKLNGYTIPEGTQVLVKAYAIGRDPTIWEDSLEFKPERYMASKLDIRGQDFELIPFGLPLALRMIPIMLGSLLNNFDWDIDTRSLESPYERPSLFALFLYH